MNSSSDILENDIRALDPKLLPTILIDRTRTTKEETHNIIWATDNYVSLGEGYQEWAEITEESVSGENGQVLRPRVDKSREEQEHRSRDKAEVFTPAWICNAQNNLIDGEWFGGRSPFNEETEKGWVTREDMVAFPEGKTWQDYVRDTRLEMTCGEAPYLVSRYNVVTGECIPVKDRIGLLDRKLRIVGENCATAEEWLNWAEEAYKATYGFEWQGDSLVLAREALVYTFLDHYQEKFGELPPKAKTRKIAEIVSWNLWQMDGLKCVIPGSCYNKVTKEYTLFGEEIEYVEKCEGCATDNIYKHNGIYCRIKDWKARRTVRFVDLLNK